MTNRCTSNLILTSLFAVLVMVTSNPMVRAQNCPGNGHWTGTKGDWFDGSNWHLGCIPTESSDASINNNGAAMVTGSDAYARAQSLTLGENQGDSGLVAVTQSAVLDVGNGLFSCGSDIYIGHRGNGTLSIKSEGFVKCRYGYVAAEANPTRPASNGTVTLEAGTKWYFYDSPTQGCTGAGLFIGCTPGSSGVGGTATVNLAGGTIDVRSHGTGTGVTLGQSGTLSGNGILRLDRGTTAMSQTMVVYGTLAPGTGAGLTLIGNLDLSGNNTNTANTVIHVHHWLRPPRVSMLTELTAAAEVLRRSAAG